MLVILTSYSTGNWRAETETTCPWLGTPVLRHVKKGQKVRGEVLAKHLVKLAEGSAQCRLTSFIFRSRANLAASRWAAFLASSSSLNFSSCASNWAETNEMKQTQNTEQKITKQKKQRSKWKISKN